MHFEKLLEFRRIEKSNRIGNALQCSKYQFDAFRFTQMPPTNVKKCRFHDECELTTIVRLIFLSEIFSCWTIRLISKNNFEYLG